MDDAKELAERRRIEEARTKIEKQDAKDLKARELPNQSNAKPLPEKPKKEFVVESATDDGPVQKDYGPIPDKKYAWLKNGVAAYPQEVKFLMMNGAEIDLLPQKAGVFYMTNDDQHGKARHKVTLTRPFWVSRYCVTAMQWREFDEGAVADCQATERAVGPKYPVSKKMTRQQFDKFCEYLTNRYRTQLPKGYVFRLPSEAEWEYALDWKRNCMVIGNMWEQVLFPWIKIQGDYAWFDCAMWFESGRVEDGRRLWLVEESSRVYRRQGETVDFRHVRSVQ